MATDRDNQPQPADLAIAQANMAKAFQDLAKGERTAAAIENQLSSIEKKIDDLLARADEDQRQLEGQRNHSSDEPQRTQQPS